MNPNLIFLNSFLDVSEETYAKLIKISRFKELDARVAISKPGEVPTKMYMLVSGIMRTYISTETGKEFNKNFFMPFSFVAPLTALIQEQPSKLTYETVTTCKVYELNFKDIVSLCEEDIKVSNLYRRVLEHIFMKYEERQLELISMDAKERYIRLRKKIPNIDKLLPQYQIASYLSITPVQLSRIRRSLNII